MNPPLPRIGLGIDLHRLEPGRRCRLGGLDFDCEVGPDGHSDADVVLHAVCDAVLGAAGAADLGSLFPDKDPTNQGRDSADFCVEAMRQCRSRDLSVGSLDVVVECNRPKLGPRRDELRAKLAELFQAPLDHVNIKGKTGEATGPIGEGRAVRATAVVLLIPSESVKES